MAKLSKFAKKMISKANNKVMRMIILPLFQWAYEDEDAFFFVIVGNKHMTDVAWANTEGLSVDGALAVVNDPDAAAVFEFIKTTFDCVLEDNIKDESFNTSFQAHEMPSTFDREWVSTEIGIEETADKASDK